MKNFLLNLLTSASQKTLGSIKDYLKTGLQMDLPILLAVAAIIYFGWNAGVMGGEMRESFMTASLLGDISRLLVFMIAARFFIAASDRLVGKEYFSKAISGAKPSKLIIYYALRNSAIVIAIAILLSQ